MGFIAKLTKPNCRDCYIIQRGREYDLTGKKENATVFDSDLDSDHKSDSALLLYLEIELDRYYYQEQYRQQGESTARAAKDFYLHFKTYKLELVKIETEK